MKYTVFDMEGDSLHPTLIHCISFARIRDGTLIESGTLRNYELIRRFFKYERILVGHNIIRWDIPHIERLLGIKVNGYLIDTLPLSWYLYPNMPKHGLEIWGRILDIEKPEILDWKNQTIQDYIHRCEEDVKINVRLIAKQLIYLEKIYEGDRVGLNGILKYLMFKMDCAREQEQVKWKLDISRCKVTLERFSKQLAKQEKKLKEVMPEKVNLIELNVPKKLRTRDGSLSSRGQQWMLLMDELGLSRNYRGSIEREKSREAGNPHSIPQLKSWLFSLNWKPRTFKYNKDKKTNKVVRIPQISLPLGQGVCLSIEELYKKEPQLENIEGFFVLQHRVGLLKGFLRDVDSEGFLTAEIAGLTNTLRFKHATVVNLPGYTGKGDWKDGEHIRGCLTVPEGYVLCGSDMSSLEDRTKQHFMYYFDPEYVKSMIRPDFDPHLDLAEFAYKITNGEMGLSSESVRFYKNYEKTYKEEGGGETQELFNEVKKKRYDFKTVNYAAIYGAGISRMSRESGMPSQKCKILLDAYWQKNWSVRKVAKALITKQIGRQMWLYNPVSKFWYSLRYQKDKFSTLNQGTGVYCFDFWVREARLTGLEMCGQFHDEVVLPVPVGREKIVSTLLTNAIDKVNDRLRLNRDLSIDIQYGMNYAQVH